MQKGLGEYVLGNFQRTFAQYFHRRYIKPVKGNNNESIKSLQIYLKQECIPVGCVPSAAVAVPGGEGRLLGGVCPGRWGCLPGGGGCVCYSASWDMSSPVHAGICLPGGVCPSACWDMSAEGVSAPVHTGICLLQCMQGYISPCEQNDRQM